MDRDRQMLLGQIVPEALQAVIAPCAGHDACARTREELCRGTPDAARCPYDDNYLSFEWEYHKQDHPKASCCDCEDNQLLLPIGKRL